MGTIAACSLRQLRVFQEVARLQSVRKAADAVHLTQPAVTQAIAKLEAQIGALLFERRSSGTYPTAAGSILQRRVQRMFERIDAALAGLHPPPEARPATGSAAERITRSQIRALAAVAHGEVAEEAARAGVSQASLLHAARALERGLGRHILCHGAAGLMANEDGRHLAAEMVIALHEVDCGIAEVSANSDRRRGLLRIGAMPLAGSFLIGPVLNDLARSYPDAQIRVRTADSGYLSGALRRGEVDFVIGLCRPGEAEGIEHEGLAALLYVLVARRNHPLARKPVVSLADLDGYELVAPSRGATRRLAFDRLVASLPRAPITNIEASSLSTVRSLLSGSDRLALLTCFEFEHERAAGVLTALAFGPIEPASVLGVSFRPGAEPTPLHEHFLEVLRYHAAVISPAGVALDMIPGQAA